MDFDGSAPDELAEIARSVQRFAELSAAPARAAEAAGEFPREAWTALAELGVLALDDAAAMVAALRELGRTSFPGPLASTFVAARLFDDADRERVASGELVVSVGAPPLVPWGNVADRFVVIDEGRAWLAEARGAIETVTSLGGEPWGRVALDKVRDLGDATAAIAVGDVALAAYVEGAGSALIAAAVDHAGTRQQFGRVLGSFQAVAHPIANAAVRLRAARALAANAARALDAGAPDAACLAAAARLSALRAGLDAATVAPQIFGALGVLVEGPVFTYMRRIRQWASDRDELRRAARAVLAPTRQKEIA